MTAKLKIRLLTLTCLGAAMAIGLAGCKPGQKPDDTPKPFKRTSDRIMGTDTELTAVAAGHQKTKALAALQKAEQALRDVEVKMSSWLEASELSQFNVAQAGQAAKLSETTLGLLRLSKQIAEQTDGAFDVTCRPILLTWAAAREAKQLPGDKDIALAISKCGWDKIRLQADSAIKTVDGACVDLGGIAKGFGIDQAAESLEKSGMLGAMVNVGGDVRCFGQRPNGGKWRIGVRSPFDGDPTFGIIEISSGSVCTSGNYERFFTIGDKRYSHIVDPRTGRPVDTAPSVTVVAPTATIADAWATALSVLGEAGLELINENSGIEAMLVIGGPKDYRLVMTPGFDKLLDKQPVVSNGKSK
jgi:FAD:protein FMN transferase